MSVYRFDRPQQIDRLLQRLCRRGASRAQIDRQTVMHFGVRAEEALRELPPDRQKALTKALQAADPGPGSK